MNVNKFSSTYHFTNHHKLRAEVSYGEENLQNAQVEHHQCDGVDVPRSHELLFGQKPSERDGHRQDEVHRLINSIPCTFEIAFNFRTYRLQHRLVSSFPWILEIASRSRKYHLQQRQGG